MSKGPALHTKLTSTALSELLFASEPVACRRACYPGIQELLRNSWGESYTVESPNLINRFRRRIPELCRRVLLYMMLCIQSSLRLRSASLLFASETIACRRACYPGIQELLRNSWGESYTVESPKLINRFRPQHPLRFQFRHLHRFLLRLH